MLCGSERWCFGEDEFANLRRTEEAMARAVNRV